MRARRCDTGRERTPGRWTPHQTSRSATTFSHGGLPSRQSKPGLSRRTTSGKAAGKAAAHVHLHANSPEMAWVFGSSVSLLPICTRFTSQWVDVAQRRAGSGLTCLFSSLGSGLLCTTTSFLPAWRGPCINVTRAAASVSATEAEACHGSNDVDIVLMLMWESSDN